MRSSPWKLAVLAVASLAAAAPARAALPDGDADAAAAIAAAGNDYTRALGCMTAAIAYEAGWESLAGQEAVAEVILNRARHPAYPKSICGVVFAGAERRSGCQFTFTCDGALARRLPDAVLAASRRVAVAALAGAAPAHVGNATHYHANYVSPYWATSLVRVATIGAHVFYRLPGAGDTRGITGFVPVAEPEIAAIAALAGAGAAPPARAQSPAPGPAVFAPWGLVPAAATGR